MITKENSGDGSGAGGAGSVCIKGIQNGHCNICGRQLIEFCLKRQQKIAHVCDNINCDRFKSPQFYTDMPASLLAENKARAHISLRNRSYSTYLERKKANYRLLRDQGVDSVEAARMTSDKQTRLYLESIGYWLAKGGING